MQIPLRALKAAALIAPKKDIRYYLNGVFIEEMRDHIRVVATDGSMAVVMRVPGGSLTHKSVIIPRATIDTILTTKDGDVQVTETAITAGASVYGFTPVDGEFPDIRRVYINPEGEGAQATFPLDKLVLLEKAGRLFSQDKKAVLHIYAHGRDAAKVRVGATDDFAAIIMPMKDRPLDPSHAWVRNA